jgi:uncharacterized membrane protein
VRKKVLARWRSSFLTGLVVVLPTVITFAVIKWLVGTVSSLTDLLLFFLPLKWTHEDGGKGPMYWYWSLAALILAVILVMLLGVFTRYYIGKRVIEWLDTAMLRVPLLNKVYGTIKQVNEAFAGSKTSFKTVVLVEFPRDGLHSVGFVTNEQNDALDIAVGEKLISVFIPTTPNPTSGFLILVPEKKITKLEMSVADGIKYAISLGSIAPESGTTRK